MPVIIIVCTGFIEEFVFRGVIYKNALEIMSTEKCFWSASSTQLRIYLTSLFSGDLLFLLALLLTKIYHRQQSLIGVSFLHGL